MNISNKEVSDKLQKYFLEQDSEVVAHICANLLIDLNRYLHFEQLSKDEQEDLKLRTRHNMEEVHGMISETKKGEVVIVDLTDVEQV